jgi:hypothetical protein
MGCDGKVICGSLMTSDAADKTGAPAALSNTECGIANLRVGLRERVEKMLVSTFLLTSL